MSEFPVLENAPIVEALLDIKVDLPEGVDVAALARVQDRVKDRFPERRDKAGLEFRFEQGEAGLPELADRIALSQGFMFVAPPEQAKVFRATVDGFTFSQLKPYRQWSIFIEEARELWRDYCDVAHPLRIKRIGLRTINRISLPLPLGKIQDYLLTLPDIAPGLPTDVSEFFMRLVMPQPDTDVIAIVTTATEPSERGDVLPVVFDIDVFAEHTYDPQSEDVWRKCEELRSVRNKIFYKSITPATKELFT